MTNRGEMPSQLFPLGTVPATPVRKYISKKPLQSQPKKMKKKKKKKEKKGQRNNISLKKRGYASHQPRFTIDMQDIKANDAVDVLSTPDSADNSHSG